MNSFHCAKRRHPECVGYLEDEAAISKMNVGQAERAEVLAAAVAAVDDLVWADSLC